MNSGAPVPATTLRRGTPKLGAVTLRAIAGRLLVPKSSRYALEQFGEVIQMPFEIHADWPIGSTDLLPIAPGDTVVRSDTGQEFPVFGVRAHYGQFLRLGVQVQPE